MNWFAIFLFLYAFGIAACVLLVPGRELGTYFFRFHAFVVLGLAALGSIIGRPLFGVRPEGWGGWLAQGGAAGFAISSLIIAMTIRSSSWQRVFVVLLVLGMVFVVGLGQSALLCLHLATSAFLLGVSLVAMILGHWYLTNAALSFSILQRLTRLFIFATVAKLVVSGAAVVLDHQRTWSLMMGHFDGLLAWVRVLVGLGGVLVLAWMAHVCAKIKSNQSATGILYVAVTLVLIGELVSLYLTLGSPSRLVI